MWYSQYSAQHKASSTDYAHCTHAQKHKQRTDTYTPTHSFGNARKNIPTLSLCLIYMHTLSSTLRPDTRHAVKAKVVLLANDPLHTPHIRQREGLTEHKKRGITPHHVHWKSRGVWGSVGVEKAMDYMAIMVKRDRQQYENRKKLQGTTQILKGEKKALLPFRISKGNGNFFTASKAAASTFKF